MIRKGMLHDVVAQIQTRLAELGHDPGPADGWFGPVTTRAVAAFERALKLPESGIIGPELAKQLGVNVDFAALELPKSRQQLTLAKLGAPTKVAAAGAPTSALMSSTYYEELLGVGYQPQLDRLEAIVVLKQPNGYLGNPCEGGSSEHVRFYIDMANDGTWTDLGVASFDTSDLPIAGARHHAVRIALNPDRTPCNAPKLPRVRAILSWREVPPPNQPEWTPTWGNAAEAHIQLPLRPAIFVGPLVDVAPIAKATLPSPELMLAYAKLKVGPERYAAPKLSKLAAGKSFSLASASLLAEQLQIDPGKLAGVIAKLPSGSTQYEKLEQVGYDADRRHLVATLSVKQNAGYSGDTCHTGSLEYVRFWRWDPDAAGWIDLGVSSVRVHDIERDFPLGYAVALPVDFSQLRKPCTEGPVILRVRATLSWNQEPPAGNPNWVPSWGNIVEAKFDLEDGVAYATPTLAITAIANQAICKLGSDGLYDDAVYEDRPFGGDILIGGMFSHVGTLGPNRRLFYRITVTPPSSSPEILNNGYRVWLNDATSGVVHQSLVSVAASTDGWYEYLERPGKRLERDMLGLWRTGAVNGLGSIAVEAQLRDAGGNVIETVPCVRAECESTPAGSGPILVMLDNEAPTGKLTLTAGDCHTYVKGTAVTGTFEAADEYYAGFSLGVDGVAPIGTLTTSTTLATATRREGTWSLDTSGMRACGYVVRLVVSDRAIVGSYAESTTSANYYVSGGHYHAEPSSGFCIVDKA